MELTKIRHIIRQELGERYDVIEISNKLGSLQFAVTDECEGLVLKVSYDEISSKIYQVTQITSTGVLSNQWFLHSWINVLDRVEGRK